MKSLIDYALISPYDISNFLWGISLLLVFMLYPYNTVAQQGNVDPIEVEHYLHLAAENNPALKAEFSRYLSTLEEVPQVKALPDPELAFGFFISPVETRVGPQNLKIGLTQMFPWFGTLSSRSNTASNNARARFQSFRDARNHLFFRVKSVWYELYEIRRSIEIMSDNLSILETFESLALRRYEAALVSQVDVLRVQIEKEDLKIRLEGLKDDLEVLKHNFSELLNSDTLSAIDIPGSLRAEQLDQGEEELKLAIINNNPKITGLDFETEATRSRLVTAQKEGMPRFGLGFDYIITDNRSDVIVPDNGTDALLGRIGIQIPLYRGKYRANEKQAALQLKSVQDQREAVENRLLTQFEEANRDYRDSIRRLKLYRDVQIRQTRQAIDVLIEKYASASTDFEELLRMQRRLLDYELSREQAIVDQNTSVALIEYLYGKYNVNLNEIQY